MTYISRQSVQMRIKLWDDSAAIHFCQLAQKGAAFANVTYPTGLKMVRATVGKSTAEVRLAVAKQLRNDGWRIRCA